MADINEQFRPQLDLMSNRARRGITVEGLLRAWSKLVDELEIEYNWSIYEYTNDLDHRGLIQDLIEQGPAEAAATLKSQVAPLDDRFGRATRLVGFLVATFDKGPWAYRVPTRTGPTFAEDLRVRYGEQG